MGKFFKYTLILPAVFSLVFAVGGVIAPNNARAQQPPVGVCTRISDNVQLPSVIYEECVGNNFRWVGRVPEGGGVIGDIAGAATSWAVSQVLPSIEGGLAFLMTIIMKIASWLTGLAAIVLNGVIYYTVVNISQNYGRITAIQEGWGVIRDLANMGFIFILLYAAIKTILGMGEDNQKLIVRVIIVAILINFSLFFTRLVIDASNVLALFFYDAIAPGALNATATWNATQAGLSNAFMQHLNLQTLYNYSQGNIDSGQIITIGVMGTILLLIAAFIFFAVAIMFVIRYVVLVLVLVLSPIAFMAFVLPQLKTHADQWWKALSGQAFFAPIYFVLTYVTVRILANVMGSINQAFGGTEISATDSIAGVAGIGEAIAESVNNSLAMFINFVVVIVFLIASLIISKQWANKAGGAVAGATKWASNFAGGATFGLAARAGRYTVGAAAEMTKDTRAYRTLEAASAKGGAAGFTSKLALNRVDKTSRASFDFRGSRAGGATLGGLDAGQAKQGGFEADRKGYREFMEKPGTEAYKKRQERARKAGTELDITNNLSAAEEFGAINAAVATAGGVATPAQTTRLAALQPQVDNFEKAISASTTKEIEAIVESNRELLDKQEFANRISVQQLEAINKSDKFSEQEKDMLKNTRFAQINGALATGGTGAASVGGKIKALSDSELEMIDPAHLRNSGFVEQMRPAQVKAVIKSPKFTTSQKDSLKDTRKSPLLDALDTTRPGYAPAPTVVKDMITKRLSHEDVAGLMGTKATFADHTGATVTESILTHPEVLEQYTPKLLKRMADEMNTSDIKTVRDVIENAGKMPGASKHLTDLAAWLNTPDGANFS